ncbi:YhgE/Pip domain-containing protein [Bacillus sp. NEB1478]|uniref:YhgE/Pip domain-containing protein n=1 Tax=Bacillus sp. NEB1478 TaxID=3073816 RepID=UPI002873CA73|nr:YhgE/Pip domain-containing protein [Bacillus sp. NEB1478]WNB93023.1 YhgE/Pip domain-containing protein [Bacillus sp. NEB1478]
MTIFNLLSAEFAKLAANKAILFSVIAALLVPVVYGGILLSATWGPYDNLSNLPVAVVNNDKGAVSGDQAINVGDDLVTNLKSGKDLGWKFVNSTEAMKGLQKNDYYMAIIIPEDFSHRVTTVLDPNPKKLELEYIQNEGLNFLASKVTETATQRIREKLGDTITEQYVAKVFSSLGDVSTGFGKAADGSSQLADGTTKLHKGTSDLVSSVSSKQSDITKLANGTKELKSGTGLLLNNLNAKSGDIQKLSDGSGQLHDGTVTLHDGTLSLKDGTSQILAGLQKAQAGSQTLSDGVSQKLVPGSRKVADGTGRLKVGSAKLATGAQKLVAGLKEYKKANPTVNVGPYYQQIIDGAEEISAGLTSLSTKSVALNDGAVAVADGISTKIAPGTVALNDGLNKLVAGQTKVDAGAGKLEAGAGKLEAGAGKIADGNAKVNKGWGNLTAGVTKLDAGAGKISDGNQKVDEGWKRLSAGATKLNDGAGKINDGSEKLSSGLKTGAEKTGGLNNTNENIKMFAAPVKLKSESVNEYHHYRDSTAPYVLTLGLFAGILIMSLFIDFKRPSFISSFNWFAVKFMNLAALAIAQAILLLAVVLLILKVDVSNPFGLIIFAIVVSVVFSAIVLFLAALGGNIGRFVALGFVILQLSITGANLPIEMLPENLRNLSEYLPFTYSIAGFKAVISLNDIGAAFSNMFILLSYLVIFALLSFAVFNFKKKNVQKADREAMA